MGDGVLAYFGWPAGARGRRRARGPGRARHRGGRRPARRAGRRAARGPGRDRDRARGGRRPGRRGRRAGGGGGRRDPEPGRPAAGAGRARQRGDRRGHAPAPRRPVRAAPTSAAVAAQGLRRAGAGLPRPRRRRGGESRFEALHAAAACRRWSGASRSWRCCSSAGEQAKGGEGQVVLLSGEAGHRQVAAGARRCGSGSRDEPHAACATSARRTTPGQPRSTRSIGPARARGRVRARRPAGGAARQARGAAGADRGRRARGRRAPGRAARRSRPATATRRRRSARSSKRERTFAALLRQLDGLGAPSGPVLVVFEDVHWTDPTTLELLDLAVERAAAPAGPAAGHLPARVRSRPGPASRT